MSISKQFDLTREEIIEKFRSRIKQGKRNKLNREERETLTLLFLDRLIEMNSQEQDTREQIEKLCLEEKNLLEEGFPKSSINSVYLPNYTRVLREAIAEDKLQLNEYNSYPKHWVKRDGSEQGTTQTHYALDFLTYDTATQNKLRAKTTVNNNKRQDSLKPIHLYAYIFELQKLLTSEFSEDLTIAIAGLTGRRHAEVVCVGEFEITNHPYLIHFQGQQKKADSIIYEILSLIPADQLIPVIQRYREMPEIKALNGLDDDDPKVEAFNSRVNRKTQSLFGDSNLVPVLDGFKTVSIHRLRGIYGAIAIHYFCRDQQHQHRFLQNYLGHVLNKDITAPNSRATDHYFHYYLVDEHGTPITTKGVKLKDIPQLPEFPQDTTTQLPETPTPQALKVEETRLNDYQYLQIYPEQYSQWINALNNISSANTQQDKMAELLSMLESPESRQTSEEQTNTENVQPIIDLSHTLALLTEEVLTLRQQVKELTGQRDEANGKLQNTDDTQSQITYLKSENLRLKQSQSSLLAAYNQLLANNNQNQNYSTNQSKNITTQEVKSKPLKRAHAIFEAIKQWNQINSSRNFALTKSLLEREFNIHREAAAEFLEANQIQIDQYHKSIGITKTRGHNRQIGRNIEELKNFVNYSINTYGSTYN